MKTEPLPAIKVHGATEVHFQECVIAKCRFFSRPKNSCGFCELVGQELFMVESCSKRDARLSEVKRTRPVIGYRFVLTSDRKIAAIKAAREYTGSTLKEAKDLIEGVITIPANDNVHYIASWLCNYGRFDPCY